MKYHHNIGISRLLKYHPSKYPESWFLITHLSQRSSFPNNSWSFGCQLDFFFLQRDFHVFFAFSEFLGRRISGTTWKTWYCISIHSSEFMSLSSTRCMMIMTMLMMMMMMMMMVTMMMMMIKPWRVALLHGYSHRALCSDGSAGRGHHGPLPSILSSPEKSW